MSNKILVLGGTGKTGRRIAQRLTELKIPHAIGSRNADPPFDWDNPLTWEAALNGISNVYISFHPDIAIPKAIISIGNFVVVAKKMNVQQLVLLSGRGEPAAMACEDLIIHSGIEWIIVRSSWFMQNFSESFLLDSILQNEVILPTIKANEPFIDVDDIADVAVQALTNNIDSQRIYELTGPDLLNFETTISKIAAISKRKISYQEVPMDEYGSILRSYQIPEDFIQMIKHLFTETLDGRNEYTTTVTEKLLGRKAGSFDDYLLKAYKTGVWNNVQ